MTATPECTGPKGQGAGRGTVAAIYNSAVAAWAIAAAWEIGALDELHTSRTLDAEAFAARRGLDRAATVGIFRALASVGVVQRRGPVVVAAGAFDEVYRYKSFFHWLSRGNAELFRQMPSVLVSENRVGEFYQRDAAAIAYACREIGELCYAPAFWAAMKRLGFELGHDLMGVVLPTVADWESVFGEASWDLVRTNTIDMTVGEVIFELG